MTQGGFMMIHAAAGDSSLQSIEMNSLIRCSARRLAGEKNQKQRHESSSVQSAISQANLPRA